MSTDARSWDTTPLWKCRVRRIRALVRQELRQARLPEKAIDLDDMIQDALLAWINSGIASHEFVAPAAITTVRQRIADAARAGKPRNIDPRRLDAIAVDAEDPPDPDDEKDLHDAIAELPPRLQRLAHARMLGTRPLATYAALARAMGCTRNNVMNHSLRAARSVAQRIRQRRATRRGGVWTDDVDARTSRRRRPAAGRMEQAARGSPRPDPQQP